MVADYSALIARCRLIAARGGRPRPPSDPAVLARQVDAGVRRARLAVKLGAMLEANRPRLAGG